MPLAIVDDLAFSGPIAAVPALTKAYRLAGFGQLVDVVDIEVGEQVVDLPVESTSAQKVSIGRRRGRKPTRDGDTQAGEVSDHFAERSVLSTDCFDIAHAKLLELDNVWLQD